MNYKETLAYLYNSVPMFQQVGQAAYKEGLENTLALDRRLNCPHRKYKTIHVGGTNGKGSCSHTLAAILQSAGYKTGLYTSPHLVDFRERIRINGVPITEDFVVEFVEKYRNFFEPLSPSFFELTTTMAFDYFASQDIEVAVVEVGLGGRLDCTNIIMPDLCLITNISLDHVQFLGDSLERIAFEKAGIIKSGTPVVIGETTKETRPVFLKKAKEEYASIIFAEDNALLYRHEREAKGGWIYQSRDYKDLYGELGGLCQIKNTNTLLSAVEQLIKCGYKIKEEDIRKGFGEVCELTGLMGRWQKIGTNPTIICDTGHNTGGIKYVVEQLGMQSFHKLHMVIGMVNDKDVNGVLSLLPEDAIYYFTRAKVARALPADELKQLAAEHKLQGQSYTNVADAVKAAKNKAEPDDFIFVGGSSFIVADLLSDTLK